MSYHQHVRFVRRVRWGALIIAAIALVVGGVVFADSLIQKQQANEPGDASAVTTSTVQPSVKIFRTSYFQFQASKSWSEIAGETTGKKFVYRGLNKNLIQQELVVYIDDDPQTRDATMVLPVEIQNNGSFAADKTSEHCKKAVPKTADLDPQMVKFMGVSFICAPDSVGFMVVAGEKGGTTALDMRRTDGSSATYRITYRNVTAQPDSLEFESIINSFQTR